MKYFGIIDKNVAAIFQLQWKIWNISDMFLQYSVLCGSINHAFSDATAFFLGCRDHIVWMDRDELYRFIFEVILSVGVDGKSILHELQSCRKEECTLQTQRISQHIMLGYLTIFILSNLSRPGKNDEHCTAQSLQ